MRYIYAVELWSRFREEWYAQSMCKGCLTTVGNVTGCVKSSQAMPDSKCWWCGKKGIPRIANDLFDEREVLNG